MYLARCIELIDGTKSREIWRLGFPVQTRIGGRSGGGDNDSSPVWACCYHVDEASTGGFAVLRLMYHSTRCTEYHGMYYVDGLWVDGQSLTETRWWSQGAG